MKLKCSLLGLGITTHKLFLKKNALLWGVGGFFGLFCFLFLEDNQERVIVLLE